MKVLFITSNRLGDAVLSTGLLEHIVRIQRDAEITIVCGHLPASLFEGMPCLAKIIPLKKRKYNGHWIKLWRDVVGTRWDIVVDLRDSAASRLIRARQRYVFSSHIDKKLHKVEQCAAVMNLDFVPSPRLWFSQKQLRHAEVLIPDGGPVLSVGPTANWIGKTWPVERFIETVEFVTGPHGVLPQARVAVFAAPGEEDDAKRVLDSVPHDRRIDMIAKTDPGTAAAALKRCRLYIGNDSGLMHCAAAVGVPTVGLFGPSYPHIYRPWGTHTTYVRTPETFDQLVDFDGYNPKTLKRSLMGSLQTDDVQDAVKKLWNRLIKDGFFKDR